MSTFSKGIFKENPVFAMALGLCPALAVTSTVWNAIGMGFGVIFVLICSNIFISLLRDFIPDEIHIPAYIVVIASFVTVVELLMKAYLPSLAASLGIFIPLIVVNCVILGRAEAFASKNSPLDSFLDGLGMGIGFTIALVAIALVREILGAGSITLFEQGDTLIKITLGPLYENPIRVFAFPAGALIVMGYFKVLFESLMKRSK
ncbi:MAG: electron transport complex subunit RsxE [Spirochaetaceae bacterium 4572_7]|nr:MAG: electron transport complex subunit RsxE [Spirochaetaceae bacterium 4572_7]